MIPAPPGLDPELMATLGLVSASSLDAPENQRVPGEHSEDGDGTSSPGEGPTPLPWSRRAGASARNGAGSSRRGNDDTVAGDADDQEPRGIDAPFEPAGSRSMRSLAQRQREVVDAEAKAAGTPRWRPPSHAKPDAKRSATAGRGRTGGSARRRGTGGEPSSESERRDADHVGPAAHEPVPAPDWADVGAAPSWATEGELPERVTEILEAWDREEEAAAELIAVGIEVLPEDQGTPKPPPEPLTQDEAEQLGRAVALRLLTAMPRTRHELEQKMAERDIPVQAIAVVLDRFEELRLIDDRAFAEAWVESRARSKGVARSRLKQELRRKGISAQDLEPALEQIDGDDERHRCEELALKKLGSRTLPPAGPSQDDRKERDKVLRRVLGFLARKGYPGGMAMGAARSAMNRHDAGERG